MGHSLLRLSPPLLPTHGAKPTKLKVTLSPMGTKRPLETATVAPVMAVVESPLSPLSKVEVSPQSDSGWLVDQATGEQVSESFQMPRLQSWLLDLEPFTTVVLPTTGATGHL